MRAAHLVLATCLASARANPIAMRTQYQRRSDDTSTTPKPGDQLVSPCPDLIDPNTQTTAKYYYIYNGIPKAQEQSTQFIRDHWGLPDCCNKLLHYCVEPPNPLPVPSPCPHLTDDHGNQLQYYNNAYTTYQFASNYAITIAIMNNQCKEENRSGPVSSLPPPSSSNLDAADIVTLPADPDLAGLNGGSSNG